MPAVSALRLVDAMLDAIQESGEVGVLTSALQTHPRKFAVSGPGGPTELWVFAWTLTFGGRPALANEYRIQMTSVRSPLKPNPTGLTVLMGYEPNLKAFAGFDLERHRTFATGSPSVQIDVTALHQALQDGLTFHRKENNEIAIAIRPDQFMTYARNASELHAYGRHPAMLAALTKASRLQVIRPADIEKFSSKRRRVVETVSRLSRSANFREQVLNGYGQRCAVTRMQLRLVEAAHILPVAAPGSTDHILNGIALSPTYHRAFDYGLIYLNEQHVMRINPDKEESLSELRFDGGLKAFKESLGKIHLPADRRQWPDLRFIKKANRYRRIPAA